MQRSIRGSVLLIAAATAVFVSLALSVDDGEPGAFDRDGLLALRRSDDLSRGIGPDWVPVAMRDATALGGFLVQALLVIVGATALVLRGRRRAALLLCAAVLGGFLLSQLLKGAFDRPRPDVVPPLTHADSGSFPSGHAMMTVVTFLVLGAFARGRLRLACLAGALVLAFLVGVSRVYLGVHYPTDVLAGWAAGFAWAGAWWIAPDRRPVRPD